MDGDRLQEEENNVLQIDASSYWAEIFTKEKGIKTATGKTETDPLPLTDSRL